VSLTALDLNLLLVLDSVLAERSVARAARRLHVTPSAISNALARLRVALGDPLLVRRGRGVVPTPRANELAPIVARALRDLEAAVQGGNFAAATTTRTFTLAIADVGQIVRLPHIAARLASEMPHARLRVVSIDSLVSLGGVAGPEVDVAIGIAETVPGVHADSLFDEPSTLVARARHPAIKSRSRRTLPSLRHVAVEMVPGKGFRDPVAVAYARASVTREVAMTVPTFSAAAAVVAATDYVATLPCSLLEVLGPRMDLRALAVAAPAHTLRMQLWWHERTHSDAALIAFRALVRRALHSVPLPIRATKAAKSER
jgi:DNA-binding transcriptional LysR family regulator